MSILRSTLDHPWTRQRRPDRPTERRSDRSANKADTAVAARRRETVLDAGRTAAHAAYFLNGGRYL